MKKFSLALFAVGLLSLACGCDQTTRYKVLSTIFDGVPNPPPPEQVCEDYAQERMASLREELISGQQAGSKDTAGQGSEHPPYQEKKCNDCHDRKTESGFVTATKRDLCFHCHVDFIQGSFVHGPVAVRDCLACHDPHSSRYPSLLKVEKSELCATCHREKRLAADLHDKAIGHKMQCTDCHDPHDGNARYFLK